MTETPTREEMLALAKAAREMLRSPTVPVDYSPDLMAIGKALSALAAPRPAEPMREAVMAALRDHYDARPANAPDDWRDGAEEAADAILALPALAATPAPVQTGEVEPVAWHYQLKGASNSALEFHRRRDLAAKNRWTETRLYGPEALAAARAEGERAMRARAALVADAIADDARVERTGINPTSVGPTGQVCLSIGGEASAKTIASKIRALPLPTPSPRPAEEVEAAANIMDVMMGGDRAWRDRVDWSDRLGDTFLSSADWQQAMSYAQAAFRARSAPAKEVG